MKILWLMMLIWHCYNIFLFFMCRSSSEQGTSGKYMFRYKTSYCFSKSILFHRCLFIYLIIIIIISRSILSRNSHLLISWICLAFYPAYGYLATCTIQALHLHSISPTPYIWDDPYCLSLREITHARGSQSLSFLIISYVVYLWHSIGSKSLDVLWHFGGFKEGKPVSWSSGSWLSKCLGLGGQWLNACLFCLIDAVGFFKSNEVMLNPNWFTLSQFYDIC
jgi:hypothetical protein